MSKVLYQEAQQGQYPQTVIIKKNQEDWKNYNDDPIGKPKNLAQVNKYVSPETVYGVIKKGEECSAAQCIRGDANWKEVQPDFDLGRATKLINQYEFLDLVFAIKQSPVIRQEFSEWPQLGVIL